MAALAGVTFYAALKARMCFCRTRTKDYYRFGPLLHLCFDGDPVRNAEIRAELLSPQEVVAVERADEERLGKLQEGCLDGGGLVMPKMAHPRCDHLFHCGAGYGSFTVGPEGTFRLCSSLWHPDMAYALHTGTLREAWEEWVPRVRDLHGTDPAFLEKCRKCEINSLCARCPAHAALETGAIDDWVEYFCEVARARAAAMATPGEAPPGEAPGGSALGNIGGSERAERLYDPLRIARLDRGVPRSPARAGERAQL